MSYALLAFTRDGVASVESYFNGRTPTAYPSFIGEYETVGEALMALKRHLKGPINAYSYTVGLTASETEFGVEIVQPLTDGAPNLDVIFVITEKLSLDQILFDPEGNEDE